MEPYVELSRLVNLERLHKKNLLYSLKATPSEAAALAQRFGVVSIDKLKMEYAIESGHTAYKGYYLTGSLQAEVIQSCVVSLKEVPESVDSRFSFHVVDQRYQDETFHDHEDDDIEFSIEDVVDLGEISAQYLSLSLNPYPRASADSDQLIVDSENSPPSKKPNPFAILKSLKP
ncbi:YceD family protein [Candidatus Finniella inopinata]|uniref:DUF177 domain-containing protein n=1 Tax=Candidatus Finniella inopinata TaxID=1696036 RepID=A0A4Q7DJS3_9PROT|nr:DUF177 domain-containing protein [Candidatus Finniella inopinata]RZI46598.1 DUF177 domain-containing protein [Candidatus Finniella inopinata]